ncbi:MAG: hypothetical protein CSA15_13505, partial [Candidatus Delongbacteria bacterium]
IKTEKAVFTLLRELNDSVDIYLALQNPYDELWNGNKKIITALNDLKIFNAKQHLSLLLSAYNNLGEKDFVKIVKICSVIY